MPDPAARTKMIEMARDAHHRQEETRARLVADAERAPRTGDVYHLDATPEDAVAWVLAARDPADGRFLVIPCDAGTQVGTADVAVREDPEAAARVVRCRYATWISAETLDTAHRVAVLSETSVARIRERWHDLGSGRALGNALERATDEDPEYEDWLDEVVAPARETLPASLPESQPRQMPPASPHRFRRYAAAALTLFALGGLHLWRQEQRLRDLTTRIDSAEQRRQEDLETALNEAEERHGVTVRQLETERDRLTAERDRLRVREHELEAVGAENEQEARELRDRVAALDRRLVEVEKASEVVNPAIAYFSPPEEARRGKVEVTLRPEQSYVVLFLPLRGPSPAPRYQLKVRVKGAEASIWRNDRLVVQKPGEIRAGLPVKVLKQGEYQLELLALEGEKFHRVAEYELVVLASSGTPKG